jgi:hypothetical protein
MSLEISAPSDIRPYMYRNTQSHERLRPLKTSADLKSHEKAAVDVKVSLLKKEWSVEVSGDRGFSGLWLS